MDRAVYRAPYYPADCVNVTERADIACLNALQLCAAQRRIYFADEAHADYVKGLITQHPPQANDHQGGFNVLRSITPSGEPYQASREFIHMYEPSLPITLDLSFIKALERPSGLNLNSPRRPAIVERMENSIHSNTKGKALGIDELVQWVESELVIR